MLLNAKGCSKLAIGDRSLLIRRTWAKLQIPANFHGSYDRVSSDLLGLFDYLLSGPCQIAHVLVKGFFFRRYAILLSDDRTVHRQLQREDRRFGADPGSLVVIRIVDRHRELERVVSGTRPAFRHCRVFADGMPKSVDPVFRVVSLRIDNERISFPMAHRPSKPSRIGVFRKSDVVRPDFTIVVGPVKRLQYFPRSLNEFKSPAIGVHGSR